MDSPSTRHASSAPCRPSLHLATTPDLTSTTSGQPWSTPCGALPSPCTPTSARDHPHHAQSANHHDHAVTYAHAVSSTPFPSTNPCEPGRMPSCRCCFSACSQSSHHAAPLPPGAVTLDVGGHLFTTYWSTLATGNDPETGLFRTLHHLSIRDLGDNAPRDPPLFIDRDPAIFAFILSHLRRRHAVPLGSPGSPTAGTPSTSPSSSSASTYRGRARSPPTSSPTNFSSGTPHDWPDPRPLCTHLSLAQELDFYGYLHDAKTVLAQHRRLAVTLSHPTPALVTVRVSWTAKEERLVPEMARRAYGIGVRSATIEVSELAMCVEIYPAEFRARVNTDPPWPYPGRLVFLEGGGGGARGGNVIGDVGQTNTLMRAHVVALLNQVMECGYALANPNEVAELKCKVQTPAVRETPVVLVLTRTAAAVPVESGGGSTAVAMAMAALAGGAARGAGGGLHAW
ncbi:hypothetical protein AMAG_06077 [Allomyces macrogynus ATCC 38327]|uniref:Potassium channel tetramerisation-type BTB domain-containing protein n=1 Tax=Allomyces macrogynus (strain ATCC 38327) TaxID=578462 RepID=A0A0L0SE55_ALLM3|nr:hypothetical protein AMAG_06077 [Allomyces macrogynus ATCC 38327]|eukprot:KNE60714.1 hypothetical protein AMAG_06077 [Allomyces macrogynus ATCC 38327]